MLLEVGRIVDSRGQQHWVPGYPDIGYHFSYHSTQNPHEMLGAGVVLDSLLSAEGVALRGYYTDIIRIHVPSGLTPSGRFSILGQHKFARSSRILKFVR